jgi:hypothetical protein
LGSTASSTPRSGSDAHPSSSSGRRPRRSAVRPTQGDSSATTACGTMMQAAMIRLAWVPSCSVTSPAAIGSIAAFDR